MIFLILKKDRQFSQFFSFFIVFAFLQELKIDQLNCAAEIFILKNIVSLVKDNKFQKMLQNLTHDGSDVCKKLASRLIFIFNNK